MQALPLGRPGHEAPLLSMRASMGETAACADQRRPHGRSAAVQIPQGQGWRGADRPLQHAHFSPAQLQDAQWEAWEAAGSYSGEGRAGRVIVHTGEAGQPYTTQAGAEAKSTLVSIFI